MNNRKAIESAEEAGTPSNIPCRCLRCGTIGYSSDLFCPCCGMKFQRRCKYCDAMVLHPLARYCTMCGAALDEITQTTEPE